MHPLPLAIRTFHLAFLSSPGPAHCSAAARAAGPPRRARSFARASTDLAAQRCRQHYALVATTTSVDVVGSSSSSSSPVPALPSSLPYVLLPLHHSMLPNCCLLSPCCSVPLQCSMKCPKGVCLLILVAMLILPTHVCRLLPPRPRSAPRIPSVAVLTSASFNVVLPSLVPLLLLGRSMLPPLPTTATARGRFILTLNGLTRCWTQVVGNTPVCLEDSILSSSDIGHYLLLPIYCRQMGFVFRMLHFVPPICDAHFIHSDVSLHLLSRRT